jgi:hypothetical protein
MLSKSEITEIFYLSDEFSKNMSWESPLTKNAEINRTDFPTAK